MPTQIGTIANKPGKRILVVDDDPDLCALLAEALRRHGYEVSCAANAEEAIAAIATATPDLGVLDVHMPGASGLELGTLMRDQFGIPFVFLTLSEDEKVVQRATAAGALAYLVKPSDMRQCLPTIDAAMARAAELRRLRQSEVHLSSALQQGREVSMAVGLLVERMRLTRDAAFEILREEARTRRQRISELAGELLDSAERLNISAYPELRRSRKQA